MPAHVKKLMPAVEAAVKVHVPSDEYEAAFHALHKAGYFESEPNLTTSEIILTILEAAAKVRK